MIATLNNNIILPLKNLKRHSWIVICIFMFLILNGAFSASVSVDQTEKQQLEIEIINPPKEPIFEKATYTFEFRVKDSQNKQESLTYSWRLDYKEWSTFSPETSVLLKEADLTVGMHRFQVRAKGEDGNVGTAAVALFKVIPDLQPPDTEITTEVLVPIESNGFTFQFEGKDQLTSKDKLQYSWRIDFGKWFAFSPQTIAHLSNLKNGVHSFEVKARDEFGNEDVTPAKVSFEVAIPELDTEIIDPPEMVKSSDITLHFSVRVPRTAPEKLKYSWNLDNQGWSSPSIQTSAYLPNLSNGMHQFDVKVIDEDGNEDPSPAKTVFKVAVNIELPNTKITNAPAEALTTSEYKFQFRVANSQSLIQYSWRLDEGNWSGFSENTSAVVNNLTNGAHLFQVKAKDANGNEEPNPATAIFVVELPPPKVEIINAPDAPLEQSNFTFRFQVAHLRLPVQYSWRLDGGNWSEFSEEASIIVSNLENGVHLFQVKAKNVEGNETPTPAEARFKVENLIPKLEIISAPDAPLKESNFTFQFQVTNLQTPVQYSWRLNGKKWSEFSSERNAHIGNLINGKHLFQVRVKDTDGNVVPTPAETSFIVAIPEPPDTKIITELDGPIKFSSYTFQFASTNQQVSYSWRLDGGDWSKYKTTPTARIEKLINGRHTLEVRVMDGQGRVDDTPAQLFFIVDEQVPQVFIEKFPDPIRNATYTFNLRGEDPQSSPDKLKYSWQLDEGDPTSFRPRPAAVVEDLTNGKHILRVKCKDPDGNISTEVVTSFNVKVDVPIIRDLDTYLGILKDSRLTLPIKGHDLQTLSNQLEYSYKVDEEEWSVYSKESIISLHGLKQGKHVLSVKVRDTDGNESQPYKVNFSVNLPFHRKHLFWGVVGGIVSVGFVVLAINQINLYRKRRYALKARYNPYTPGIPVMEKNRFFGRREFLQEIKASIHNTNFIIMGDNRIGKTSALYKLADELRTMGAKEYLYRPFYIDLSDVAEEDQLFEKLLTETKNQAAKYLSALDFDYILKKEDNNFYRFQFTIDYILKELEEKEIEGRQIRLIFMLDECDVLNKLELGAKLKIRSIFTQRYAQNVSAILTGVSIDLDAKKTSPWWNTFKIKLMIPFTNEEVQTLIKEPAGKIYRFKDEAIDEILNWSERSPYLVQLLCDEAVNIGINNKRFIITEKDIQTAISHSGTAKKGIRKAPTEEEIKEKIEQSLNVGLFSP